MKTLKELQEIREHVKNQMANRAIVGDKDTSIVVSMDTCGIEAGAKQILRIFNTEAYKLNLPNVKISQSGCVGHCQHEPVVYVDKDGKRTVYAKVTPEIALEIIHEHIIGGRALKQYESIGKYSQTD